MDLILWRHAEAEEAAPGGGDSERELTPRGEKQALRMALTQAGHVVSVFHITHDGFAFFVRQRAGLGEADAARIAVEQAHFEPVLH